MQRRFNIRARHRMVCYRFTSKEGTTKGEDRLTGSGTCSQARRYRDILNAEIW